MMDTIKKIESYERSELIITYFSEEDIIVTSGRDPFQDDLGGLGGGDNWGVIGGDGSNSMPGSFW